MPKQNEQTVETVIDANKHGAEHASRSVPSAALIETLDKISDRALSSSGSAFPFTCGWIVLDKTAGLRKQLGFSGLEQLMQAIHARIVKNLGAGDLAARFGLDAIGLIFEPLAGERDFDTEQAQLLRRINAELFEINDASIAATISIALHTIDEDLKPAEANLVLAAETAEALRTNGGNRGRFVPRAKAPGRQGGSTLLGQLTRALRDNSLKFLYQPLLSTAGNNRERFQLLPRLVDDEGKLIPAAQFIPVAAKRGVLPAIDSWMIRQVIDLLKDHQDNDTESPTFFLNQSPALIDDPKLLEWLIQEIAPVAADKRALVLEFSIEDLKSRIRDAQHVFRTLQENGLEVSITRIDEQIPEPIVLEHLPADYLRMKADFARRMLVSRQLGERFTAFAKAAHQASRKLIIPMLEDAESVARIWQMDVDLIQGNFIQQPSEMP